MWRAATWGVLGVVVALTACGGDDPDGYGDEHRADFVDDCAAGDIDRETCGCFYDRMMLAVPFERFERLDAQLRQPFADLPADVAALAAGCAAQHQATDVG